MTDTPERIWIGPHGDYWADEDLGNGDVEYIRADLVPQWQPIETAPKDGSFILGGYQYGGNIIDYSVVCWNGHVWLGYCDGDPSIESQGDAYTDYHAPFLTHWKPIDTPKETT